MMMMMKMMMIFQLIVPRIDNSFMVTNQENNCECQWTLAVYLILLGNNRPTHD